MLPQLTKNCRQFNDGFAYSKGKMEEVFRSGLFDRQPTKPTKEITLAKREDVDLIVSYNLYRFSPP
jgi:hypothetical protein